MPSTSSNPFALARARGHLATSKRHASSETPKGMPPSGLIQNLDAVEMPESPRGAEPSSAEVFEGSMVRGRAAVVAASAANREILPVGSTLSVYWEGSDDWYDTTVLGHKAQLVEGSLAFKHECEYDGGAIDHDLGHTEYEITKRAAEPHWMQHFARRAAPKVIAVTAEVETKEEAADEPENLRNSPEPARANDSPEGIRKKGARKGHVGFRRARKPGPSKLGTTVGYAANNFSSKFGGYLSNVPKANVPDKVGMRI